MRLVEVEPDGVAELAPLFRELDAHHRTVAAHLEAVAPRRHAVTLEREELAAAAATLEGPLAFCIAAVEENRVVGMALVGPRPADGSHDHGPRTADLQALGVATDQRGRGSGRATGWAR